MCRNDQEYLTDLLDDERTVIGDELEAIDG